MSEQTAYISDYAVLNVLKEVLKNISKVSGIYGGDSYEIKTNYNKADSEVLIQGRTNSFIVLGRDRNEGIASGNGGRGHSGAACIDLIAGHQGPRPLDTVFGEKVLTDKNFKDDSARVYITQKAINIDDYFNIPKVNIRMGNKGVGLEDTFNKSAAATKADLIRVIARENIKIVTFHKGLNSQNKKTFDGGIDIIAGCNAIHTDKTLSLQPMVKGSNLELLVKSIIKKIEDVQSTVSTFMRIQKEINDSLANHVHQSGAPGTTTDKPISNNIAIKNFSLLTNTLPDILRNNINIATIDKEYMSPFSDKYILSLWNRVN